MRNPCCLLLGLIGLIGLIGTAAPECTREKTTFAKRLMQRKLECDDISKGIAMETTGVEPHHPGDSSLCYTRHEDEPDAPAQRPNTAEDCQCLPKRRECAERLFKTASYWCCGKDVCPSDPNRSNPQKGYKFRSCSEGEFASKLRELQQAMGVDMTVSIGPLKQYKDAFNKVAGRGSGPRKAVAELYDIVRATLVFKDLQGLATGMEKLSPALGELGMEVLPGSFKNRICNPECGGYRDLKFALELGKGKPNEHTAEIQISVSDLLEAKEKGLSTLSTCKNNERAKGEGIRMDFCAHCIPGHAVFKKDPCTALSSKKKPDDVNDEKCAKFCDIGAAMHSGHHYYEVFRKATVDEDTCRAVKNCKALFKSKLGMLNGGSRLKLDDTKATWASLFRDRDSAEYEKAESNGETREQIEQAGMKACSALYELAKMQAVNTKTSAYSEREQDVNAVRKLSGYVENNGKVFFEENAAAQCPQYLPDEGGFLNLPFCMTPKELQQESCLNFAPKYGRLARKLAKSILGTDLVSDLRKAHCFLNEFGRQKVEQKKLEDDICYNCKVFGDSCGIDNGQGDDSGGRKGNSKCYAYCNVDKELTQEMLDKRDHLTPKLRAQNNGYQ